MYKLLRIALFALPLAGGAAFAQGSGTSGSAGAPGATMTPPVTNDTRTPLQQKAGRTDDTAPAMPGDATKPSDIPNTVPESDRTAMPDTTGMTTPGSGATDKKVHKRIHKSDQTIEHKTTVDHDTTKMDDKADTTREQMNSDK